MSARYSDKLVALKADVTSEESVTKAVDEIVAKSGAIHGFVCNAGRTKHKPALDFTTEEIEQLWNVNVSLSATLRMTDEWLTTREQLFGSFYCARVAARAFIKLGIKGSIVFTASMASYRPNKVCGVQQGASDHYK